MIQVSIGFPCRLQHFIDIKVSFIATQSVTTYELAKWRPGRYEAANYAQFVRKFTFLGETQTSLESKKTDHSSWELKTEPGETYTIKYQYYAFQMNAGGSWVDDELIYLNPINCIGKISSLEDIAYQIKLDIPSVYRIGCALPVIENQFIAKNYQELVDSPLIASEKIENLEYVLKGTTFNICCYGYEFTDKEKLKQDFINFTQVQLDLFDGFPTDEYTFLLIFLPYRHYHGVEHKNSTVITLGPTTDIEHKLYPDLLGVSSHELFHCWNVTRIRPKEMLPYNFTENAYHVTGYVTEGITTYYGDLMLKRAQVFTIEEYYNELNTLLTRHFHNAGRHAYSIMDSSFDLWLDGYKQSAPDKKVSIYTKGALITFLIDLQLRKASNNAFSFDDIIIQMWRRFGQVNKGYTHEDFIQVLNEFKGLNVKTIEEKYLLGTFPLENDLQEVLSYVGLAFVPIHDEKNVGKSIGCKTTKHDNYIEVIAVHEASPNVEVISVKDKLLKLDGIPAKDFQLENQNSVNIELERFGRRVVVKVEIAKNAFYTDFKIVEIANISEEQKKNRALWLN